MPATDRDRVIALAAMFQATAIVGDIARKGQANNSDFQTCLESILKMDAESSEAIYGDINALHSGLQLMIHHLQQPRDAEITWTLVALLKLQRKLEKRPSLMATLQKGIEQCIEKQRFFSTQHSAVIAALGDLYRNTISTLSPRIMVHGNPQHLQNPDNQNKIRTMLLAGIRAAVLWRQSGGGHLTLVLRRKPLLSEGRRLLANLQKPANAE